MKKADFLKEVATRTGSTKANVEEVYNTIADLQKELLLKGEGVEIQGLGKITVKDVAARNGVNPKTKEKIVISARKALKFKAGSKIKAELN